MRTKRVVESDDEMEGNEEAKLSLEQTRKTQTRKSSRTKLKKNYEELLNGDPVSKKTLRDEKQQLDKMDIDEELEVEHASDDEFLDEEEEAKRVVPKGDDD